MTRSSRKYYLKFV